MLNQEMDFKVKIGIFQRGFGAAILVQTVYIYVAELFFFFFFFCWNYFCGSQNEQINR